MLQPAPGPATFKRKSNGTLSRTVEYAQKNLQSATCDDNGSGNGGASGRGTATDIDLSGDGPLGSADGEDGAEPAPWRRASRRPAAGRASPGVRGAP